jgi:hypothetical protein
MAADECNIRVVARFRPLNDSEERAGSKSVVKFPADQEETVLISVRYLFTLIFYKIISFYRVKSIYSIKYFVLMLHKKKFIMKQLKKLLKMFLVVITELYLLTDKPQVEKLIQWR